MEESSLPTIIEGKIKGIRFGLATCQEICRASISDCPISHASQLSNPFLGLPLEAGKCESCGTGEPGKCEGHFGYVELPTPIYHPDHVSELKRMLSLLCLKCLKMKNTKGKNIGVLDRMLPSCCEKTSQISINEVKTADGAYKLELKMPSKSRLPEGFWTFLEKYGFRYGDAYSRPLLPSEVMVMLRKIPQETRKKLDAKGYFPQEGYILQYLPVPPNCLSVPDISDGISITSTDYSITLLKKVLKQVEVIKNSRSGMPNFESHEIEANDLQAAVAQYLQFRGTGKASRDVDTRFGVNKEENASSTKAWLAKMKTLFIRKGSGFSSRSVITGDPFKGVSEIGLPFEIAKKITFEERVSQHNMAYLQRLVDEKLCVTYRDGPSTYSLKEGSKDHTFLRPGQVVHRRIMDGDIVFINRPPTTHKHSLQALSVYVHDDHTVKINPLICGPLSADFDGDCIHLFYPQSLEAKAEVVELFSVEKQLLSSHTGNFNLQLATDSLLSLKIIFRNYYLSRATMQQLAMFVPNLLPNPAIVKSNSGPLWTASQILQTTLPPSFDCYGEKYIISKSEVLRVDFSRDAMASIVNDIVTSIFFLKGPKEVLRFFNSLQPLLMETLYMEGYSVSLRDLFIPREVLENIQADIQKISPLLYHLRTSYSESIALQLDSYLRSLKTPITNFILNSSAIGHLIESKSESALSKVVQQIGFLGMQIADRGKFYSGMLVTDVSSLFQKKYPSCDDNPAEEFGLVGRPLFRGLDPYQEMVHSISSREVTVRSTRGLTEPGTLFKNLMAILRDVVICHDSTVRNKCSNSIIQFEYGVNGTNITSEFCPGDPVGVLAATAISNPAYKAVLDSSPSSNSSWEMMKEILLCGVSFKNEISDRRVILYLNDCGCGRKHCQENAALIVKNQLKKVSLKEMATEFLIEYRRPQMAQESYEASPGLVGHIHLNKTQLIQSNVGIHDILEKCQETINLHRKKKKLGNLFKRIDLSCSECCTFCLSSKSKWVDVPCIQFLWQGVNDDLLEKASHTLADTVCPVLLQTNIKGDPRVSTANIIWTSPDTATWIRSPSKSAKGEMALDVILEKEVVRKSGDAWRVVMDSCLSIIHLIDTRRSTPYAIKQVQELLGISCAFEQAVQRLSTSVTMVTKGVLKDHLLLLGNSMTCAGTLIGFNSGGIKSLSRLLSVQVPFTDATLFTPRKCFERAAEKCHVDSLSSIVASCAWGKQVSVGTGSPFEVLWDTRKAYLRTEKEIDVYNFLHLVSDSSKVEDMSTDCLGAEIEDLEQEDEYMGLDLSPVHESSLDKPSFEDGIEFVLNGDNYDAFSKEESHNTGTAWGKKLVSDNDWTKKAHQSTWAEEAQNGSAWGKKKDSDGGDWEKKLDQTKWARPSSTDLCSQSNLVRPCSETNWGKKDDQSTCTDVQKNNFVGQTGWERDSNEKCWNNEVQNSWDNSSKAKAYGQSSHHRDSNEKGWRKANDQHSWGNASSPQPNNQSCWARDEAHKDFSAAKSPEDGLWSSASGDRRETAWDDSSKAAGWNMLEYGKDLGESGSLSSQRKKIAKSDKVSIEPEQDKANYLISLNVGDSLDVLASTKNPWDTKVADQATHSKPSSTWNSSNNWGKTGSPPTGPMKESLINLWSSNQKQSNDSTVAQVWGPSNVNASFEKDVRSQWGWGDSSKAAGWNTLESGKDFNKDVRSQWGRGDSSMAAGWNTLESGKDLVESESKSSWKKKIAKSDGNCVQPEEDVGHLISSTGGVSSDMEVSKENLWEAKLACKEASKPSNTWGSSIDGGKVDSQSSTGQKKESPKENLWEVKVADQETSKPSNSWGSSNDWGKVDSQCPTGQKKESTANNWGSNQKQSNDFSHAQCWGSSGKDVRSPRDWSGRSRGRGSSNAGEWKKRTRPVKPVDDPNAMGIFTTTKQRLDLFTVEEQDVLSEIESIMKNIRRVMHQTGYNDGDPLSADDQKYIMDNVFNHHPDKAVKMGAGIDYIMVNRHGEFQDSRCFYAVSVDGGKEDFSYRKCLENYIREKFPGQAEAFIPKYFRKPQPRAGWNRDRGPPKGEAGTPSWNRDSTPCPDEAGTPTWNRVQTPGLDDAGTPGWSNDRWSRDQTPGPDDTATLGGNNDHGHRTDGAGTPA